LKYHPDKDDTEAAALIFNRVAEAYDVLSSGSTKATFDVLGEAGLKDGVPDGRGGVRGGHYTFDVSPISVFETFHGTENPYRALMDVTNAFEKLGRTGSAQSPDGENGAQRTFDVFFTLEELHNGCEKTLTHERKVQHTIGGEITSETRTVTLKIPKGCEHGRRFVFENEGNIRPGLNSGPIVYVVQAKKHETFKRKGYDLIYVARVSLIDAISGCTVSLTGIDGSKLTVPVTDIVDGGSTKVVGNEGMAVLSPMGKQSRGDLLIVFDVVFPKTLSPSQRNLMKAAFFFPSKNPNKEATKAANSFLLAANDGVKGWSTGGK
tara:strand:- start:7589 stop:8551 length:963 start_codon:yes stop_codon:yes gene_type:complete